MASREVPFEGGILVALVRVGPQPIPEGEREFPTRRADLTDMHMDDARRVAAAVETLLPWRRGRVTWMGVVLVMTRHQQVARPSQAGAEGRCVGVRESQNPHLNIEDVFGEQPVNAGRPDMIDADSLARQCCGQPGDDARARVGPPEVRRGSSE